jgi:hypothetical protein
MENQTQSTFAAAFPGGYFLPSRTLTHASRTLSSMARSDLSHRLSKPARFAFRVSLLLSSLAHVKKEFPFSYKFDHWKKVLDICQNRALGS